MRSRGVLMTIEVANIPITVIKKSIKNLHLSVMPPNGEVRVSAPLTVTDESIIFFVRSKIAWIRKQCEKFEMQLRQNAREFVSGETLYVWGKQYFLRVEYSSKGNDFVLTGNTAVLTVRKESTAAQRENYVNERLRELLKAEIEKRLPLWEQKTGFKCVRWGTKVMKTHWGSYSQKTHNITFNLHLATKPFECLDYIIVHELGHTKFRNHGKGFIEYMDRMLPFWRETKKLLNDFTLDFIEA
jgi:predicted metal-dependent hydrolase